MTGVDWVLWVWLGSWHISRLDRFVHAIPAGAEVIVPGLPDPKGEA